MTLAECEQYALENEYTHMSHKGSKCRLGHEADCDDINYSYKTNWDTWRLVEEPCDGNIPTFLMNDCQ